MLMNRYTKKLSKYTMDFVGWNSLATVIHHATTNSEGWEARLSKQRHSDYDSLVYRIAISHFELKALGTARIIKLWYKLHQVDKRRRTIWSRIKKRVTLPKVTT